MTLYLGKDLKLACEGGGLGKLQLMCCEVVELISVI